MGSEKVSDGRNFLNVQDIVDRYFIKLPVSWYVQQAGLASSSII